MIIRILQKYLFACIVVVYTIASAGIPVYLHYCGGELEEVSYITKADSCCGDEEPEDGGCCKNEGIVLKCNPDSTLQKQQPRISAVPVQELFSCFHFSFRLPFVPDSSATPAVADGSPPQQKEIVDSTVLRI